MKRARLLIVDDEPLVVKALSRAIQQLKLPVLIDMTSDPIVAKTWLERELYDILITDQRMPEISGLKLIKSAKNRNEDIQCILMSGFSDFSMIVSAINDGHISGFIMKPWQERILSDALTRALDAVEERVWLRTIKALRLNDRKDWVCALGEIRLSELSNYMRITKALVMLIRAKDVTLYGHSMRVAERCHALGKSMGLLTGEIEYLEMAAMLHDLGKIAIRDSVHYKSGKLDEDEYAEMKRHADIGADILRTLETAEEIAQIIEQHHEHVDGTGYPRGLMGDEILIGAKILAVADAYDALTSDRVYRTGFGSADALAIMRENAGKIYDETVIGHLIRLL